MELTLSTHLYLIFAATLFSALSVLIAYFLGYFTCERESEVVPWQEAGAVFMIFFGLQFLLLPFLAALWFLFFGASSPLVQGWWNLFAIGSVAAALAYWGWFKRREFFAPMFRSSQIFKDISLGIASWFVVYPIVLLISQLITFILGQLLDISLVDQLAVRQIRKVVSEPFLLGATLFSVLVVVPVLEELLFRGFLQGALRPFFSRFWTVVICSAIFALFHFSLSQGANNATIVISLFILALFLGFLRERQGNLWAPIALHMTFNTISVAMILAQFS
jgi:membrane protease YdiL (CAAX protease family)